MSRIDVDVSLRAAMDGIARNKSAVHTPFRMHFAAAQHSR
jgi:hypothetical protein